MSILRANTLFLFIVTALLLQAGNLYSQNKNVKKEITKTTKQANQKSVTYWMSQLSHSKYSQREQASAKLIKAGFKAVKPLQQHATSKDLEVALRAVNVLGDIYNQAASKGDEKSFQTAENALTQIAITRQRTISASADILLKSQAEVRRKFALRKIEKLGGIITWLENDNRRADFPEAEEQQQISSILLGNKWKGDDASLQLFHRIPELTNLMISGKGKKSPVSEKGINFLESSFPNLFIQYRGSACLGIAANFGAQISGCPVSFVKPGSAADKGGLAINDIITHFGKSKIRNFQMLIDAIADHDPDEKVAVQIKRDGKTKTLEITLQEWKK